MDGIDSLHRLCALSARESDPDALVPMLVRIRDVNEPDDDGYPPLWYASSNNPSVAVLDTLLHAGALPNAKILEEAVVRNPNPEVAKRLLTAVGHIEQIFLDRLFLLAAASNTTGELVRYLIEQGSSVEALLPMDIYPETDIEQEAMLDGSDDDEDIWHDVCEPVLQNALVVALYENPDAAKMIRILIDLGVSISRADEEGYTVLMHALDHPDVVKMLIIHGVDIDAVDLDGQTALMHACAGENTESALALITAGADVHVLSESGETALHHALGCHLTDNLPVVRALVLAGADVNLPDGSGAMPLHIARLNCAGGSIIELLEHSGATMGDAVFLDCLP